MRVRTFFLVCMSVSAVIAVVVAGQLVENGRSRYAAETEAGEAIAAAASLMRFPRA